MERCLGSAEWSEADVWEAPSPEDSGTDDVAVVERVTVKPGALSVQLTSSGIADLQQQLTSPQSVFAKVDSPSSPRCDVSVQTEACFSSRKRAFQRTPEVAAAGWQTSDSAAVSPTSPLAFAKRAHVSQDAEAGDSDDEDTEFIPPHLIGVPHSLPAALAARDPRFRPGSVLEGAGRKLRGFDAIRVRTAVMQQTGFLEPGAHALPASTKE